MRDHHYLIERLRENLEALLRQDYSPQQLNDVVLLAHSIAATIFDIKAATGSINRDYFYLSSNDAAYDCIADLFRRDDEKKLIALTAYFSAYRLSDLSDADILSHFRRLVFTKVNDGIARLYRESDPMLSRILRNIKLAVHSLGNFIYLERFGEQYLAPTQCDLKENLPPFDEQSLESLLITIMSGNENIMEIIGSLALELRNQNEHNRSVNIMQVALVIRSIYSRKSIVKLSSVEESTQNSTELIELIHNTVVGVKHQFHTKYVKKGKTFENTYQHYFEVIDQKICQMMIDGSPNGQSLFHLMKHMEPELTEEAYRSGHKSRLEYLFKLSCDEVIKKVRS